MLVVLFPYSLVAPDREIDLIDPAPARADLKARSSGLMSFAKDRASSLLKSDGLPKPHPRIELSNCVCMD